MTDFLCGKSWRPLDVDQCKVTPHGVNKCDSRATYIYWALIAMQGDYDAIVIGSGLGGLTADALFAHAGHRVLVLEQNQSFGGAVAKAALREYR